MLKKNIFLLLKNSNTFNINLIHNAYIIGFDVKTIDF